MLGFVLFQFVLSHSEVGSSVWPQLQVRLRGIKPVDSAPFGGHLFVATQAYFKLFFSLVNKTFLFKISACSRSMDWSEF